MISMVIILIFIDILLLITGQYCSAVDCTLSSMIFNAILDFGDITVTQLFSELIGDLLNKLSSATGLLSLGITGAVLIGAFVTTKEFRLLLIPMALSLALLASDFVTIGTRLISLNPVLGTLVMAPITITYVMVIAEWWRGKD